jgi:hypothetical protein
MYPNPLKTPVKRRDSILFEAHGYKDGGSEPSMNSSQLQILIDLGRKQDQIDYENFEDA